MFSLSTFWNTIWRFIRPEIEEMIVYVLTIIGFGVYAFVRAQSATATIADEYSAGSAFSYIQEKFMFLTEGDDTVAKIFTFGLWFAIGTAVYGIAWFLITFSSGAFKDIEVSSAYVHPRTFDTSKFWVAILGRVILRSSAAVTLVIYIAFWCAAVAPAWLGSFTAVLVSGLHREAVTDAGIALIGIAFTLHFAAILLRLVLLRSRYSYQR